MSVCLSVREFKMIVPLSLYKLYDGGINDVCLYLVYLSVCVIKDDRCILLFLCVS